MGSIVQELQRECISRDIPITDLLRKAFLVSKKLKQNDILTWVINEMNGYTQDQADNIPSYRKLTGSVKAFNPYHGWQPIMFEDVETVKALSEKMCFQSASEIEHLLENSIPNGIFEMPFDGKTTQNIMDALSTKLIPSLHVQAAQLYKIIDSIRNTLLNWALQLEDDSIIGDEVSFTNEEIKKASSDTYNITNFYGNVSESQVQQGTDGSKQEFKK